MPNSLSRVTFPQILSEIARLKRKKVVPIERLFAVRKTPWWGCMKSELLRARSWISISSPIYTCIYIYIHICLRTILCVFSLGFNLGNGEHGDHSLKIALLSSTRIDFDQVFHFTAVKFSHAPRLQRCPRYMWPFLTFQLIFSEWRRDMTRVRSCHSALSNVEKLICQNNLKLRLTKRLEDRCCLQLNCTHRFGKVYISLISTHLIRASSRDGSVHSLQYWILETAWDVVPTLCGCRLSITLLGSDQWVCPCCLLWHKVIDWLNGKWLSRQLSFVA